MLEKSPEQFINNPIGKPYTKNIETTNIPILPSITNEEIKRGNNLFAKKNSASLNPDEENELKKITTNREINIKKIFPDFSFEVITELQGTRPEAEEQYKLAKQYFTNIIRLSKTPGAVYNLALNIEKLKNWEKDPQKIETSFPQIYEDRKSKFNQLNKQIKIAQSGHTKINQWENRITTSQDANPKKYLDLFNDAIIKEELTIKGIFPNHLREAVLYQPTLAEEGLDSLKKNYDLMKSSRRKNLKKSLALHKTNIDRLKAIIEKINNQTTKTAPRS